MAKDAHNPFYMGVCIIVWSDSDGVYGVAFEEVTVPLDDVDIAEENIRFEGPEPGTELRKNIEKVGLLQDVFPGYRGEDGRVKLVVGRSRFLVLKQLGHVDIKVRLSDGYKGYEGLKASFSENIVRNDMDPVTRALAVNRLVEAHPKGITALARDLGIPRSSLSEWVSILRLDPSLLELLRDGRIPFETGRKIAVASVPLDKQRMVAEMIQMHGASVSLVRQLLRDVGAERRGAPPGLLTIRFNFNPGEAIEKRYYDLIQTEATRLGVEPGGYVKGIVQDHLKGILKEAGD